MAKRSAAVRKLLELPVTERLKAVEELWDSIADEGASVAFPTTSELVAELNQRLEQHRREPDSSIPWDALRDELSSKRRRRRT